MIGLLIDLVILCIVAGLAWWIIGMIPLPPPVRQIVTVVFVVIIAVFLIYALLGLAHGGLHGLSY